MKRSKTRKRKSKIGIFIALIVLFIVGNIGVNQFTFITPYTIESSKIPSAFHDYKIIQLTDVHSIRTDRAINSMIHSIKEQEPNLIVITGDLVDARYYSSESSRFRQGEIKQVEEKTIQFVKELTEIADVYYIYGNHEIMLLDDPENNSFKVAVQELGVKIINNQVETIRAGESEIHFVGIQDPSTLYKSKKYANVGNTHKERIDYILEDILVEVEDESFTILLSHRPEYFDVYAAYPIDLALTGHTHGGIIRIPGIGGLYANPQGWFPKYSSGLYSTAATQMIVGRGIVNTIIPIRIMNPPEIVSITLKNNGNP